MTTYGTSGASTSIPYAEKTQTNPFQSRKRGNVLSNPFPLPPIDIGTDEKPVKNPVVKFLSAVGKAIRDVACAIATVALALLCGVLFLPLSLIAAVVYGFVQGALAIGSCFTKEKPALRP